MFTSLGIGAAGIDPETAIPLVLRTMFPVGFLGLILAAYFSAILSTADSCLMAASGNVLTDLFQKIFKKDHKGKELLVLSQITTFAIGVIALLLALQLNNVLSMMLYSYGVMVSGLFVPTLFALFSPKKSKLAAFSSMVIGSSIVLIVGIGKLQVPYELDLNILGIFGSFISYITVLQFSKTKINDLEVEEWSYGD